MSEYNTVDEMYIRLKYFPIKATAEYYNSIPAEVWRNAHTYLRDNYNYIFQDTTLKVMCFRHVVIMNNEDAKTTEYDRAVAINFEKALLKSLIDYEQSRT